MRNALNKAVYSREASRHCIVAVLGWGIPSIILAFLVAWSFLVWPVGVASSRSSGRPVAIEATRLTRSGPQSSAEISPAALPALPVLDRIPGEHEPARINTAEVAPAAQTDSGDVSAAWDHLGFPVVTASPSAFFETIPSETYWASAQSSSSHEFDSATSTRQLAVQTSQPLPVPQATSTSVPIDVASEIGWQDSSVSNAAPLPKDSVSSQGNLLTVEVRGAPLHSVLSLIAVQQGLSIAANSSLDMPVTVSLQPTTLENALDAVTSVSGCTWTKIRDVIYVTPIQAQSPENFVIQGRAIQVFDLNYASGTDLEKVVTGLLSPIGKVFVRQVDTRDKLKAMEQLVVEDIPAYVARICNYVAQADRPPRQVMVEARILQVKLSNENRHGINFDALVRVSGADVHFKSLALATGLGPAGVVTVDGTDFDSLVECIINNGDTKTLASPKLLMINGQESKIQIGRRLGYLVATTTQTSTIQDVQFLEVGIVLTVTPHITEDGRVLMKVHPKVSNGDINATTSLPEEETTEVDTSVLVNDGSGVIIGGLIQELDDVRQSKLPLLGDLWLVGKLFQRNTVSRSRNEIIVALLPRIVPIDSCPTNEELDSMNRVLTPLLTPTLDRVERPEPQLNPSGKDWVRGQFQP